MKKRLFCVFTFLAGVCLTVVMFAAAATWHRFDSSTHFSVAYPGDWFRFGVSADRLEIRSSEGGAEAVIIKRGQAYISVMQAEGSSSKTLAQVIDYYTQGSAVTSTREVSDQSHKQACTVLQEIISTEPIIPPQDAQISVPNIVNTELFCKADGRTIVTVLRNWKGDQRQGEYQQIALRMTRSIRLLK